MSNAYQTLKTLVYQPYKIGRRALIRSRKWLRREGRIWQMAQVDRLKLMAARRRFEPLYAEGGDPLVSVTIATYNRGPLLVERTLPSILSQTYPNIEVIVVGDHCTDNTASLIEKLDDPRVQFHNRAVRGPYPEDPKQMWYVAGIPPYEDAIARVQGQWIAHMDDDEVFEPDHVEVLLRHAQAGGYEYVWSKGRKQFTSDRWEILGEANAFGVIRKPGVVVRSSMIFRTYLKLFRLDPKVYKMEMPGDKQCWARMRLAGVRVGFVDAVTMSAPLRPGTTQDAFRAEDRPSG